jgi:3-phenylpropionate/trans-cinnamate dioxygenase ferredoxin subunit
MTDALRIAPLAALPAGRGLRLEVGDARIALFRIGDDVYAIGDRCSHAEASLAEGEVYGYDVECPRHGSEFDVRTGRPGALPATRPVPVYETSVVDGVVFLRLSPDGHVGGPDSAGVESPTVESPTADNPVPEEHLT